MRWVHIIAFSSSQISNRFKVINNYCKTIKRSYIKILSDHFNVISDHFKTKKCILSQPYKDDLTVRPSHLRIIVEKKEKILMKI